MNEITMTPAAQVIVSIIPIVGILIGGVIVFFYLFWRNKQITLLIKSGNYVPLQFNIQLFSLLTGVLLTGVGFILTVLFIVLEGFSYVLLGGLIPFILGVCLVVFYVVYKKKGSNEN